MRIGIDATALPVELYGAGNYIVSLVQALPRLGTANEFVVFTKSSHAPLFQSLTHVQTIQVALPMRILRIAWEQTMLPALVHLHHIDLLHSPHYTMPLLHPCKTVVTFHDMTFFLYPEMHQLYKKVFFRTMIHLSARRADTLIADSQSTCDDLVRLLRIPAKQITPIPLGVSSAYAPLHDASELATIRERYQLPAQFILFVGVLEPRKNLPLLIRAFVQVAQRGLPHSLVIVGRKGWRYNALFRAVESSGVADRVQFTGYVSEADLPTLYNAADVFVYPSLYEGFGLPVLEAMACGIPVITSNVSSMPEVAEDAAILVNPHSVDDLTDALHRVLTDSELRVTLSRKGLERARLFSWERTARETLAVCEQAFQMR